MQRKTGKKILILIAVIVILSALFWVLFYQTDETGERRFTYPSFLPFGPTDTPSDTGTPGTDIDRDEDDDDVDEEPTRPHLRLLVDVPVAGYHTYTTADGVPMARYILRESGNIVDINLINGQRDFIGDVLAPSLHDAYFLGEHALVARYYNTEEEAIESLLVQISEGEEEEIDTAFFESGVTDIALHPTRSTELAYLRNTSSGSALHVYNLAEETDSLIYESPLREWNVSWQTETNLFLTTKPSGYVAGRGFQVHFGQRLQQVIDGYAGLRVKPHHATSRYLISYTDSTNQSMELALFDEETRQTRGLRIDTFTEKCLWRAETTIVCGVPISMPNAVFPDAWYQNRETFSDVITQITFSDNLQTSSVNEVYDPVTDRNLGLDMVKPQLIQDDFFTFVDQKTNYLWVYEFTVTD